MSTSDIDISLFYHVRGPRVSTASNKWIEFAWKESLKFTRRSRPGRSLGAPRRHHASSCPKSGRARGTRGAGAGIKIGTPFSGRNAAAYTAGERVKRASSPGRAGAKGSPGRANVPADGRAMCRGLRAGWRVRKARPARFSRDKLTVFCTVAYNMSRKEVPRSRRIKMGDLWDVRFSKKPLPILLWQFNLQ